MMAIGVGSVCAANDGRQVARVEGLHELLHVRQPRDPAALSTRAIVLSTPARRLTGIWCHNRYYRIKTQEDKTKQRTV